MLDIKKIRENSENVEARIRTKIPGFSLKEILEADGALREKKDLVDRLKNRKNSIAKEIGQRKRVGEDLSKLTAEGAEIGDRIGLLDAEAHRLESEVKELLSHLPNLPMPEVPVSSDPAENVCLETVGEKPLFSFTPKHHLLLNETLSLFDFARGAKIAGTGWPCYRGAGARLEWALIRLMLDTHTERGFEMWIPPLLARPDVMYGSAHLPKFEEDLYKTEGESRFLYLIPTAEAVLNGLHYDEIIDGDALPFKYTAFTPCFRKEAGAAGRQERGLIRTHQFNKVELFCVTRPEESGRVYEEMVASAEAVLEKLELHYRKMLLVTGDIAFPAAKTIDLEVWLPGQERYYEVSSLSDCTDFQARRSKMRYKKQGDKPRFCHTLNGSGLATSRLMAALLENRQTVDGRVVLPEALRPYFGGDEIATCPSKSDR
ncbi:MAG: serine--tRNA ligase [Simkaniaceae bacterium]|nr:serine--tRNA ligase [Simkaniaceae bacterium]